MVDTLIRKAIEAIFLPTSASTERLLSVGLHNTMDELIECHLSNQKLRLSRTAAGRHTELVPTSMFGFRKNLGTQDILLQLKVLGLKQATRHSPKAILALDLKGAFDNVTHDSILPALITPGCGKRTYAYIRLLIRSYGKTQD